MVQVDEGTERGEWTSALLGRHFHIAPKFSVFVDSQAYVNNCMNLANLASRHLVCDSLDANRI